MAAAVSGVFFGVEAGVLLVGLLARCLSLATICDVNVGVTQLMLSPDAAGLHFRLFPALVGPVIIDACLSSTWYARTRLVDLSVPRPENYNLTTNASQCCKQCI